MRVVRILLFITVFLGLAYSVSMFFVDESKSFSIEKEINYPLEKIEPQFSSFQNMSRWNAYFLENPKFKFQYFIPYSGVGSSMNFIDEKGQVGMAFLRYQNKGKILKYELFPPEFDAPLKIDVRFSAKGATTKILWVINTPEQPLLKRYQNLFSINNFESIIDQSMDNLKNILSDKIDKSSAIASIKYDSIMIEEQKEILLIGINATIPNKSKTQYYKNLVKNYNKITNFVTIDLGKKDDEFGLPMLLTPAKSYASKEASYFYGIPLSKKSDIIDNSFMYREIEPSKLYVMYYKGSYEGRIHTINKLLKKAMEDSLKVGMLQETFVQPPEENQSVLLKIAIPVKN